MSYDNENRMVSYADGSGTTASVYNGDGQKVKQGAATLVWDGWDYLGEVNSGTFDCETFTVDGQILAEKRSGTERLDFERTALGSVCTKYDQTNQARAGVQRYKPYGSLEFHDSTLPTWQWVGSWGYRPTGLSWSDCYVRARHYGTQQAQWTTVDPLWPSEPRYSYCLGSPYRFVDPTGLQQWEQYLEDWVKGIGYDIYKFFNPPIPKPIGRRGPCEVYVCSFTKPFIDVWPHQYMCVRMPNGGCSGGLQRNGHLFDAFDDPNIYLGDLDAPCNGTDDQKNYKDVDCQLVSRLCSDAAKVCRCIQTEFNKLDRYRLINGHCRNYVENVQRCAGLLRPITPYDATSGAPGIGRRSGGAPIFE